MCINTNNLRDLLLKKGWRQVELAKAAGFFSASRLNAALRGWQRLGPASVERLLAGLRELGASDSEIEMLMLPGANKTTRRKVAAS